MNEKDLTEAEVIKSLNNLISRKFIEGVEGLALLQNEMKRALSTQLDQNYVTRLVNEAQKIVDLEWFKQVYSQSPELNDFYENYKKLKGIQ